MSCNLTIAGIGFDIDAFVSTTRLHVHRKRYRGEPVFKTKPDSRKAHRSLISVTVSDADFDKLDEQIADTIAYLTNNYEKLKHITTTKGIDIAVLDFGQDLQIDRVKRLYQEHKFPGKLLLFAGELGLDIQLSIYAPDMQVILENQSKKD